MANGQSSDGLESVPATSVATRVDQVHFEGLSRTKRDILIELAKPLFQTKDFAEALYTIQVVRQRFYELGLFRNIKVSLDENTKALHSDNLTNLSVTFDVEETKRYAGGIFTSASNNEASLILELRSPNLLGRGEEIQGKYEHSLKYFSSWSASFHKPLIKTLWPSLFSRLDFTLLQSAHDAPWSNYKQLDRGFLADLNVQHDAHNSHSLRLESIWRYLSSTDVTSSFKIREQLGHSLKSSISHTYTYDRRDSSILPSRGFMLRLFNEYAGFHKEHAASFYKNELECQANVPLFNLLTFQLSSKFGLLKPISNVLVSDKFFLGGPLNVRGFKQNGLGPHNQQAALGANIYWASGLHLYLPLPFKNSFKDYLRLHGFVNAGNVSDNLDQDLFRKNVRLSAGAGLVMSFGNSVRFELNYCLPLRKQADDKFSSGLQFGIGLRYI